MQLSIDERKEFNSYLNEYLSHPEVKRMADYIAHGKKTVLAHCIDVACFAYVLNKRFHLHADMRILLIGALLHDFYLYDWHGHVSKGGFFEMHGFTHPRAASNNAVKYFGIDQDIQKVIESHMWPLTLRSFPSSREAAIVCLADKMCALKETINRW